MSGDSGRYVKPDADAITLYLHEIGNDDLLTAEEEVQLAKQIEAGQAAAESLRNDELDESEQQDKLRLKTQGEEARAQFIRSNTRLVVSIAKQYRGYGLQLIDLIQEGNIGLIKAVDEFDHRMGNKFSTYATYWIRQSVLRALANKSRVIRLPVHIRTQLSKLYDEMRSLTQEYGHKPTIEEIAARTRQTPEEVRRLLRHGRSTLSLQTPVGHEDDNELGELIVDEDAEKPIEIASQKFLVDDMAEVLDNLPPREAKILRLRYGLRDSKPRTLQSIGDTLGISRERVRQIERRAIRRLRSARYGARRLLQYIQK
jgi:RNA polymerase primary sigma factor